jgi:hypothetical protein
MLRETSDRAMESVNVRACHKAGIENICKRNIRCEKQKQKPKERSSINKQSNHSFNSNLRGGDCDGGRLYRRREGGELANTGKLVEQTPRKTGKTIFYQHKMRLERNIHIIKMSTRGIRAPRELRGVW